MGIPAFLGYYVTHDYESSTMSFAPHADSTKPSLEKVGAVSQTLRTSCDGENTANGGLIAFFTAFFIAGILAAGLWYYT